MEIPRQPLKNGLVPIKERKEFPEVLKCYDNPNGLSVQKIKISGLSNHIDQFKILDLS